MSEWKYDPLTQEELARYNVVNRDTVEFLKNRYNKVNRWVIADMVRRSRYHYPDKKALVFGEKSLTYTELEDHSNRVANALIGLGVHKYDRVAILAHNTIHHVLTWLGCCKAGAVSITCCAEKTSPIASTIPKAPCLSWRMLFTIWSKMSSMTCRP